MVALKRAQIRRDAIGVDVTVMSSKGRAKSLAPTWELVMGHKNGTISNDEYAYAYGALLNLVSSDDWNWLQEQEDANNEVYLLCYCRDGKFCHTHLIGLYAQALLPEVFQCQTSPPESVLETAWHLELAGINNNQVQ